jgi:hypothetical protein
MNAWRVMRLFLFELIKALLLGSTLSARIDSQRFKKYAVSSLKYQAVSPFGSRLQYYALILEIDFDDIFDVIYRYLSHAAICGVFK